MRFRPVALWESWKRDARLARHRCLTRAVICGALMAAAAGAHGVLVLLAVFLTGSSNAALVTMLVGLPIDIAASIFALAGLVNLWFFLSGEPNF